MSRMVYRIIRRIDSITARTVRYIKFEKYRRKYGFNEWHMSPVVDKPYIKGIIEYIRDYGIDKNTYIVECGCGLCDILACKAFRKCKLLGVEKNKSVYAAINEIYHSRDISFINGTFEDITEKCIDWLIAVNFTHEISDIEMTDILENLTKNNQIRHIILDEVTGNYKYQHNYAGIVPKGYTLEKIVGPYPADGGVRHIVIFEKKRKDTVVKGIV